ncbi:MAG: hypothetical protein GX032_04110 [Tenericutes bacterium]|nr:hypothetical protein [Mycoplasmatota bacterium]
MENENLKKKNNILTIILVLIFVIGIIFIGYYFLNKSSSDNSTNKQENAEIDNSNEEPQKEETNNQIMKTDEEVFDEIEEIIKNELYVFYGLNSIDDLTPEIKAFLAGDLFHKNIGLKDYIENSVPLKAEDLKKEFDKSSISVFGFENASIPCLLYEKFDHYEWTYKPETETYEYTEIGHGGSGAGPVDKQIIKENKENGLFVISYKYLWESFGEFEEELNIYTNFEDAMSSSNPLTTISRDYNREILIETKATEVLSDLDTYTYTFELIDNEIKLKDFNRS